MLQVSASFKVSFGGTLVETGGDVPICTNGMHTGFPATLPLDFQLRRRHSPWESFSELITNGRDIQN